MSDDLRSRLAQRGAGLGQIADDLAQARAVQAEQVNRIRPVMLSEIYADPEIQVRADGLNDEHVEMLAQILLNGGEFRDPIRLFEDPESGRLYLSDGFHRQAAYKRAVELSGGHEAIAPLKGEIFPGGYAAAVEDAEEHNLQHGLKLSAQDKLNIFQRRFERGHEWTGWSNVRIGAALGVSEITIRRWRANFYEGSESGSTNVEPQRAKQPESRIGADGKSYPIRPPEARAKPKGVTPPTRYAHDPDVDQVLPDEEPALTYDEVEAANWPGPIVPRDEPAERPIVSLSDLMAEARAKAAQQRDLGVDAVPDSYDADRETAIRITAKLEKAVQGLIDCARDLKQVNGIRTFYTHDEIRLAEIDTLLWVALDELPQAAARLADLRAKIEIIFNTGQPYEEDAE